jgi:hypothetical protein
LATVWFAGSGLVFIVLLIQSLFNKYEGDTQQVWAWFIPSVVPTLSLMVSVLGAGALSAGERRNVRVSFFILAWWLSIAYVVVLMLTVFGASLRRPAIDVLVVSNAWLGPLQGIAVASIGYIFVSKNALEKAGQRQPDSTDRTGAGGAGGPGVSA